jgi:branched-chain amino acid transport system substrate-binding protein
MKVGTLVVASALVLSACAGKSKSPSTTGGATGGGSKPTIEIGVQGPLSGDNQALGINIDWGVKLAVQQANAKGDLPFTLSVKDSDDQGDQSKGPDAARLLIQDPKVLAVVGPAFSGPTAASEPLFGAANLVTVSPSATRPSLTDPATRVKTFFRVVANDSVQGPAAADYMAKVLKAQKVFVIDDQTQYGTGLASAIKTQLQTDGVTVVSDSAAQKTPDYSPLASKVASSGATAMYYAGYYADGGIFAKALKAAGYTGTMLSGDGSKDPNFITTAGQDAAANWQFTCPCLDAGTNPQFASFATAYKTLSNAAPGTYSIEGYDAANTIIDALKKAGASATRQQVLTQMATEDYTGLSKEIKFTANGDVSGNSIYVYKVSGSDITLVGDISKLLTGAS